jgi:hypothetical protein
MVPEDTLMGAYSQVLREMVITLARVDGDSAKRLYSEAQLSDLTSDANNRFAKPKQWFYLKQQYLDAQYEEFFSGAVNYLRQGGGQWPILWYGLLHDIEALLPSTSTPVVVTLRQEISASFEQNAYVAKTLRDFGKN